MHLFLGHLCLLTYLHHMLTQIVICLLHQFRLETSLRSRRQVIDNHSIMRLFSLLNTSS